MIINDSISETSTESICCCSGSVQDTGTESSCCGGSERVVNQYHWVKGVISHETGSIPVVGTELLVSDRIGSWKARWGVNRMHYAIPPGIYAAGEPSETSPVLVTANYKMSFDELRSSLTGLDAWILVLDTKGINVWCAAGKGTFGTAELINRIAGVRLREIVSHTKIIVPQLGAPGVNAVEVLKRTGFRVVFGPVRASDIARFLTDGMKASRDMRRVTFAMRERLVLIPIEAVGTFKYAVAVAIACAVLSGLDSFRYSWTALAGDGLQNGMLCMAFWLTGVVLTPALLPWLPGRAFWIKGLFSGFIGWIAALTAVRMTGYSIAPAAWVGWLMAAGATGSFLGMNFTGATPFTSVSGVEKEMKRALPVQAVLAGTGVIVWIGSRLL